MIHHIKKPFYCRKGQFSDGQDLCAGISLKTLQENPIHKCRVGTKKITEYTFYSADVLQNAMGKIFIKNGKQMIIVPLDLWCAKKEAYDPIQSNI